MSKKPSRQKRTSSVAYVFALLPLMIFAGIIVLFLTMQQAPPSYPTATTRLQTGTQPQPTTYQAAPDFTLRVITRDGLTGEKFTLSSTRGKVVFMEFIMSWCSVCDRMGPTVKQLHDQYSARGVVFVTVAGRDSHATEEDTARFISEHDVTWTAVYDESMEAFRLYSVHATPTFVIIGRDGKIREVIIGARTYDVLASALDRALRE
jgi:peroxiredoxin